MTAEPIASDANVSGQSQQAASQQAGPADESKVRESKPQTRRSMFLRSVVPDFIMVLVAATALTFTISYAFNSAPTLRGNVLICMGIAIPMLVILYAGSWSKKALLPSAIGAVVYAVVVLAVLLVQKPTNVPLFADGQINDVEGNPFIFGLIAVVVPAVTYLLSRRKAGMVVLFIFGALACGFVQFMYRDWTTAQPGTVAIFVAMLTMGTLFVYQGYRSSVYSAKRVKRTSFGGAGAFALAITAVCVLLSGLVFYMVIGPMGLSTPTIKIFEDYYKRPVIYYSGTYQQQSVDSQDIFTNQLDDQDADSNRDAEDGKTEQSPDEQSDWSGNPISSIARNLPTFDPNQWLDGLRAINYQRLALGALFVVLLIAVFSAIVIFLQRWRRRRRLDKISDRDQAYRIWYIYTFLTGRLAKLGFQRPETSTPLEFAMATRMAMVPFMRNTGNIDYLHLTLVYQRACFAPETLTQDDEDSMVRFYNAFFDNTRRYVGNRRWIVDFWRI